MTEAMVNHAVSAESCRSVMVLVDKNPCGEVWER